MGYQPLKGGPLSRKGCEGSSGAGKGGGKNLGAVFHRIPMCPLALCEIGAATASPPHCLSKFLGQVASREIVTGGENGERNG